MNGRRPLVLAAALLGLCSGILAATRQFLPVVARRDPASLGLFLGVLTLVAFLVSPVGLFLVGYWAGGRVDVATEYGRLALLVGLVGGASVLVGFVVTFLVGVAPATSAGAAVLFTAAYNAVLRGVNFAITALAGAAVAYFRRRGLGAAASA